MATSDRRQYIRSSLTDKRRQLTFAFQVLALCMLFVAGFVVLFSTMLASFNDVISTLNSDVEADLTGGAILISDTLPVIGTLLVAFLLSMLLLVIERTHRIFGPAEAMKKLLRDLNDGNYSSRIKLRKDDDFQETAAKLNRLAEKLEQDHPKAGSSQLSSESHSSSPVL